MTDSTSHLSSFISHHSSFANRGRRLERAVKKLFERYEERGIHCQQNHPEQLHDGTLVKRHGFDFQILYEGRFIAFDAKECESRTWPLDKAKPHQVKALLDVIRNGGEGFFLVYFRVTKKLVKFHAGVVRKALIDGVKSLPPESGEPTNLNIIEVK